MVRPVHFGHEWPPAGGDQDMAGAKCLATRQPHGMGILDHRAGVMDRHAGVGQAGPIRSLQPV